MREHSNIMVEYIKVFEKRDEEVTIKDLIGYSGVGTSLQRLDAKIDQQDYFTGVSKLQPNFGQT